VGGPLVFLWVLGVGLLALLAPGDAPPLALLWTAIVLLVFWRMTQSNLGQRQVCQTLLRAAIPGRVPPLRQQHSDLNDRLRQAAEKMVKVTLDIGEMEQAHGADRDLRRVFDHGWEMLTLQYRLTKELDDLEQTVRLVRVVHPEGRIPRTAGGGTSATVDPRPNQVEAIQRRAGGVRALVDEAEGQVDVLAEALDQLKGETQAQNFRIGAAELARESGLALGTLRARAVQAVGAWPAAPSDPRLH
jgi:hypothetical protein